MSRSWPYLLTVHYHSPLKFSKRYGPVFTVYVGPEKVVVLAGHKTVKEALVSNAEVFGDRDVMRIINETGKGHGKREFTHAVIDCASEEVMGVSYFPGFIWANGDSWREMRRFIVTNLRDFGMGKKACEDKMIDRGV